MDLPRLRLFRGSRRGLARADCQQDFLTEGILELLELQRRLAFIAQHFEHGRTAFFRDLDTTIFKVHDVHLQRLDLKVPVVAAVWTGQRQIQISLVPLQAAQQSLILVVAGCRRNEKPA